MWQVVVLLIEGLWMLYNFIGSLLGWWYISLSGGSFIATAIALKWSGIFGLVSIAIGCLCLRSDWRSELRNIPKVCIVFFGIVSILLVL